MRKVVLASGNPGKLKELRSLLADFDREVVPQSDIDLETTEETGLSFVENAILKARYVASQTGLPAIADDSGIAVDALQGAPGIYSARFAGLGATDQQNVQKLLNELRQVPDAKRHCRFHCLMVYLEHPADPTPLICHGIWEGMVTREARGEHGFGYDPVFYVPEHDCTSAELPPEVKNQISHRAQALRELIRKLDV